MTNAIKYYFSCVVEKDTCVLATIATDETVARTLIREMTSKDVKIGDVIRTQKVPTREVHSIQKVRSF